MDIRYKALSNASIAVVLAANAAASGVAVATEPGASETQGALPAVSGVNTKVGSFGTHHGDETAAGAFIALAFPLGMNFGAQIDGIGGAGDGGALYGFGGHLFWRDPSRGLLGAYAGHLRWDADSSNSAFDIRGAEVGKVGLEGQLYLSRLSLEGLAAYQFGTESGFAGKGTVAYYVLDDLRIHLTVNHLKGPGFGASSGFEWAPTARSGISLFADIGVDEDRDVRSLVGLKFYLSREEKSLIRRHREDDPDVDLPSDLLRIMQAKPPVAATPAPTPTNVITCPPGEVWVNGSCDGNT